MQKMRFTITFCDFFLHLRIWRLCKYIQIENNPWLLKLKRSQIFTKEMFEFNIKNTLQKKKTTISRLKIKIIPNWVNPQEEKGT